MSVTLRCKNSSGLKMIWSKLYLPKLSMALHHTAHSPSRGASQRYPINGLNMRSHWPCSLTFDPPRYNRPWGFREVPLMLSWDVTSTIMRWTNGQPEIPMPLAFNGIEKYNVKNHQVHLYGVNIGTWVGVQEIAGEIFQVPFWDFLSPFLDLWCLHG